MSLNVTMAWLATLSIHVFASDIFEGMVSVVECNVLAQLIAAATALAKCVCTCAWRESLRLALCKRLALSSISAYKTDTRGAEQFARGG